MAWSDPIHPFLGSFMDGSGWGTYGLRRLIHSFVHLESLRGEMETGMEAIFEGSFGTSFHGRAMKA
jgi:hypothetical protein